MLGRALSVLAAAGTCAALWSVQAPARAQTAATASASAPLGVGEVRAHLMRIHNAAKERNYQGVFVVSAGGSMSSARITHYCENGNQFERIETMDGQLRRVFRHNALVHTLWPERREALVDRRESLATFPGLLQGGEDGIADSYLVRPQGVDRVAGHEADVLLLQPRDDQRYGHRLWAERATGLLLRAEVLDAREQVLESSAFSEVTIGVRPQPEAVLKPMKRLEGYHVHKTAMTVTTLEDEGWRLDSPVAGFRQVSAVKRPLAGIGVPNGAGESDAQAVQTTFSDGMTSVSLFIEPYDASRHEQQIIGALGATQTLTRRKGDAWITLVGDVPAPTLKRFAEALRPSR